MHFLVIGIGNIGERHIKNLSQLGIDISVYDRYADVFQPDSGTPELSHQLNKLEQLVQDYGVSYADPHNFHDPFDAFIICTPPASHTEYIVMGMQHHAHIFVEKPISNSMQYLDWVIQTSRNKGIIVQVGYQFRFHPHLILAKQMLDEGKIGNLISIWAEFGQYLPDWHPNQNYRELYTGKESEGGGIILDSSHEIDYVRWLVGSKVKQVSCSADKLSNLDVDVEDTAEINLQFENGVVGNIHVDFTNKQYTRWCKLMGDKSNIVWDYTRNLLVLEPLSGANKVYAPITGIDPYLREMEHFITCIENKEKPIVDATVGTRVLEIALAAKQSSIEGRVVDV